MREREREREGEGEGERENETDRQTEWEGDGQRQGILQTRHGFTITVLALVFFSTKSMFCMI